MSHGDAAPPVSRFFVSHRLRLHVLDWGNPEAPTLLMVHGGRDNARTWDFLASDLRRDWRVLAFDLRGHGDSDWSNDGQYRVEQNVHDIGRLLDHFGIEQASLVGHSLGGLSSLTFAGLYPDRVRRLVVIDGLVRKSVLDAPPDPGDRMRIWMERARELSSHVPRKYPDLASAAKRMLRSNPKLSEADALEMTRHALRRNEDLTYSWKYDEYVRLYPPYEMAQDEFAAIWRAVTAPVLLLHGGKSWADHTDGAGRADVLRDVRQVTFPDAGHWVHHDERDAVRRLCREFLAG